MKKGIEEKGLDIIEKSLQDLKKKIYIRESYIRDIKRYLKNDSIIVLQWQRRVWKSYLIIGLLQSLQVKENKIFFINKEKDDEEKIKNNKDLTEVFNLFVKKNGSPEYIIIDEVQDIIKWELFIRSKYSEKKYHIILSWSNSNLLSGELATQLTWRYLEYQVSSLDYKEYLGIREFIKQNWHIKQANIDDKYLSFLYKTNIKENNLKYYFTYWWMPESFFILDEDIKQRYLKNIVDTILVKDILNRYKWKVKESEIMEKLIQFLANNVGNITSIKNITQAIKNEGYSTVSEVTIARYIWYLEKTFLIHKVYRYDIKGKKIFQNKDKYFFNDIWIRNSLGIGYDKQIEKIIENLVYLKLIRLWYKVYVGELRNKEIDFVAIKWDKKHYLQVAYLLEKEETREREFWNLQGIKDNYPKHVISMDKINFDTEWINHLDLETFLSLDTF